MGLFIRTFLPSVTSFFVCAGAGVVLFGLYIFVAAWNSGLVFPNLFVQDSENWISVALLYLIPPVVNFFSIPAVAVATIAVLWGVVGIVGYLSIAEAVKVVRAFHQEKQPSLRFYALWLLWHAVVVTIAAGVAWLFMPFSATLFTLADAAWLASSWEELALHAGLFIAGWFAILHTYLVLLRLYKNYYLL